MIDFKDIIKSWWIAANPTPQQSKLAEKRLEICIKCPKYEKLIKKKEWTAVCGMCGCPISKKIFSEQINPCPLDKWIDVDKQYGNGMDKKEQKSMI